MTKLLTPRQFQVARDLKARYGVNSVKFAGDSPYPILDADSLVQAAKAAICDLTRIEVEIANVDRVHGYITTKAAVQVGGKTYTHAGVCLVPENLETGEVVEDYQTAYAIAAGRALRKVLRLAGFDPAAEYREPATPVQIEINPREARQSLVAELHILARELGMVSDEGDEHDYREFLGNSFQVRTSVELSDSQLQTAVQMLRSRKAARARRKKAA